MRRFHFALSLFVLVLAAQPLVAATYYVGTCKKGAYSSISAAVEGVPAGSTIDVCPGTYAEQVTISQALTLQGIFDDNSAQAIIAIPRSGLTTTSSLILGTVAAQVEVTAGPVNITGITVDGTASSSNCPSTFYIGVFYSSGSSGTVNQVEAHHQNCNDSGFGILAENGAGSSQSVTIENSNINDNNAGIYAYNNQAPSTLTAWIKRNYVASSGVALEVAGTAGSVADNNVASPYIGVFAASASSPVLGNKVIGGYDAILVVEAVDVSDNTVSNASHNGVLVEASGSSITSNHISNSGSNGINLQTGGVTVKSNIITKVPIGIEFACNTDNTVSGNTINGAVIGTDMVPAAFSGVNTFYNVHKVRTGGC
jgi:hypothetical protein